MRPQYSLLIYYCKSQYLIRYVSKQARTHLVTMLCDSPVTQPGMG